MTSTLQDAAQVNALCDDHTTGSLPAGAQRLSQADQDRIVSLRGAFVAADSAVNTSRRKRLLTIVQFYFMVAANGGASGPALLAEYDAAGIQTRMNDWRKAAMLLLGLKPRALGDGAEKNNSYGRVKTVGRLMEAISNDREDGSFEGDQLDVDEIVAQIELNGGWVEHAQITLALGPVNEEDHKDAKAFEETGADESAGDKRGGDGSRGREIPDEKTSFASGVTKAGAGGGQKELPATNSGRTASRSGRGSGADADPTVFDLAELRSRIAISGIAVTAETVIAAPEPQLGLICSSDYGGLLILPLAAPIDEICRATRYLPAPDANVNGHTSAWSLVSTALQFFDRTDSSMPVDPETEAYEGQDMLRSLPAILFSSGRHLSIGSVRAKVSPIIQVELGEEYALDGWSEAMFFIDGRGTNSLTNNLSSPEGRASFEPPKLSGDGKLTFPLRKAAPDKSKRFYVRLNPRTAMGSSEHDYWVLGLKGFEPKATAVLNCPDDVLPQELVRWANSAGTKRNSVKVSIAKGACNLSVGTSLESKLDAAVEGSAVSAEVRPLDFAKAIKLATSVGAQSCAIGIDPNGLVGLQLGTAFAEFKVYIPTLFEGARERTLLEEIRRP